MNAQLHIILHAQMSKNWLDHIQMDRYRQKSNLRGIVQNIIIRVIYIYFIKSLYIFSFLLFFTKP